MRDTPVICDVRPCPKTLPPKNLPVRYCGLSPKCDGCQSNGTQLVPRAGTTRPTELKEDA